MTDLRYALRMMRKNAGFTAAAVAILAVGIGVNAVVFTVTNAVLFNGFRLVDRNDRILYLGTQPGCCVSYPDFEDWRNHATSFDAMGAVADLRIVLSEAARFPETYTATRVTANSFQILGQRPILGRDFSASDETAGAAPVAILSYGFWERRYAKDPSVIGRTVRINAIPTTVIGVMAEGFSFPQNQELWVPLVPSVDLRRREARNLWFAFGRMADGATIHSTRAEMETLGHQLAATYPTTNEGVLPVIQNFHQFFVGPNAAATYMALWGAVGFVLLIACANLANLLLARAMGRSREISVRIALGAGRWRVVRQLLVESVTLSTCGGFLGWWIAKWGIRVYEATANPPARSWSSQLLDYSMNIDVVTYLIAISIGTGVLFGLVPAVRLAKLDVNTALRDGGRGTAGGKRRRNLSDVLIVGEVALAVVLLAGAGVMTRSFLNIYNADLGIHTENVLTAFLSLPDVRYPGADEQVAFFDRLKSRVETAPGVDSVAMVDTLPGQRSRRMPFELDGAAPVDNVPAQGKPGVPGRPSAASLIVSPDYFGTLGAQILSGRDFNDADRASGVPAAVVNQRFASTYWEGDDSLGKRFRFVDGKTQGPWLTVVGVASNIVQGDATRQDVEPVVYLPYQQRPAAGMWVLARTRTPPGNLGNIFRAEVTALDPELSIWLGPFSLTERLAGGYWSRGLSGALLVIFAAIALFLASIGLYAAIEHSITQRRQEIGVRMAIGATAHDIFRLVLAQGMRPVGIGLAVGLLVSLAVNRVLQSQLIRVSSADPMAYVIASITLIGGAVLGCLIPARRAMSVDPLVALRDE